MNSSVRPARTARALRTWIGALAFSVAAAGFAQAPPPDAHHGHRPAPPEGRAVAPGRSAPPRRLYDGRVLDDRYHHGRYYPPVGAFHRELPPGYRPYFYRGRHYYFEGGVWYAPGAAGFVVVRPPVGLVVGVLPPFYSTIWFGGLPYYYADDVYYSWDPSLDAYVVVDPPAGATPTAPPPAAANDQLILYPKNGQSADQQAADRYDCHRWAKEQTGFDPTLPGGGVASVDHERRREDYRRAMTACLEARGYEVK